jgi:hypothetical protein
LTGLTPASAGENTTGNPAISERPAILEAPFTTVRRLRRIINISSNLDAMMMMRT